MEKILVIGGNGSGKSTFSKILAEKTGLPLVHLDKIWCYRKNFKKLRQNERRYGRKLPGKI